MAAGTPELRTPVMIMVDVSWKDEAGVLRRSRACMEDKSVHGAGFRINTPLPVGWKVNVRWRFDQFSGAVKYCRNVGREYQVGIQRDAVAELFPEPEPNRSGSLTVNRADFQTQDIEDRRTESVAMLGPPEEPNALPAHPAQRRLHEELVRQELTRHALSRRRAKGRDRPGAPPDQEARGPRRTERSAEEIPLRMANDRERKPMARKWLGLATWHKKQEDPAASEEENSVIDDATSDESRKSASAKENRMPNSQPAQSIERIAAISAREVPAFQVELLPMEDIYRTAGIVSPRKGYSVTKVVEMLNSEHIRGLSKETKRAALLMALDAAGVTIEQVQRDAKSRQNALDSYEAEQKKQAEAEWARKAEEIAHIQAELESIKAHYTARISRNMEALARDKARFNSWVTTKEQEAQSMAEAVELCLKLPGSEPVASREREMSAAAAAAAAGSAGTAKPM